MRARTPRVRSGSADHRSALLRLQRGLYQRNRERIQRHEQVITPDFAAYETAYHDDLRGARDKPASFGELVRAVRGVDVAMVGDYHTLNLSQKTFLKLIRRIRAKRTVLALEFFGAAHQDALDAWLAGRIGERSLLRRTRYKQRWPYDIWDHFRPILEVARKRGWQVVGIDCDRDQHGTLAAADAFMAERITDTLATARKGTRVLVLVGELHVARPHLPAALRAAAAERDLDPKILTVLQNPERIYWRVAKARRGTHEDVVRLNADRWCVLNTPPTVVQQSYLAWIDSQVDSLDYDHVEANFNHLVNRIARILGVKTKGLLPVRVVTPGDVDGCDELAARGLADVLLEERASERSRILYEDRTVYLGNLSLNRVGEAAARLLHCAQAAFEDGTVDGFYPLVIQETIGFFGSKLVNPKRKCRRLSYYRQALKEVRAEADPDVASLETASAVLLHSAFERGERSRAVHRIYELPESTRARVTRALGKMLGERLYYTFVRGQMSRADVRNVLAFPLHDPERAAGLYFSLARQVRRTRLPQRM